MFEMAKKWSVSCQRNSDPSSFNVVIKIQFKKGLLENGFGPKLTAVSSESWRFETIFLAAKYAISEQQLPTQHYILMLLNSIDSSSSHFGFGLAAAFQIITLRYLLSLR